MLQQGCRGNGFYPWLHTGGILKNPKSQTDKIRLLGLEPGNLYSGAPFNSDVQPRLRDNALDEFFSNLNDMRITCRFKLKLSLKLVQWGVCKGREQREEAGGYNAPFLRNSQERSIVQFWGSHLERKSQRL